VILGVVLGAVPVVELGVALGAVPVVADGLTGIAVVSEIVVK